MIKPSKTVANLKPYFFAGLKGVLAELAERGVDVIRLDMGSPDLPPADFIVDKLVEIRPQPKEARLLARRRDARFPQSRQHLLQDALQCGY